jgi:uncharacterized protein with HEPN domain
MSQYIHWNAEQSSQCVSDRSEIEERCIRRRAAIEGIERHTAGMDQTAFPANELVQDAVIRKFEIIAGNRLENHHQKLAGV